MVPGGSPAHLLLQRGLLHLLFLLLVPPILLVLNRPRHPCGAEGGEGLPLGSSDGLRPGATWQGPGRGEGRGGTRRSTLANTLAVCVRARSLRLGLAHSMRRRGARHATYRGYVTCRRELPLNLARRLGEGGPVCDQILRPGRRKAQ